MNHGNYDSSYEAAEPDPHVVDLNTELVQCHELMSIRLPSKDQQYLFCGLGTFMEHILISGASHLRLPNQFGIKKILRNILALQQSIKSLTNDRQDSEFEKAKFYYSLFFISPKEMLNGARERHTFNFDEYQTMLNFQCGVDPSDAAIASKTIDRDYSSYVLELHGLEMDKSDTSK